MKLISCLIIFILCSNAYSQEKVRKPRKFSRKERKAKSSDTDYLAKSLAYVDDTQRFISSMWVGLNHNLDMYFSNQTYEIKKNKSKVLVIFNAYKSESSSLETTADLKLKVHFPKASKKLSLVLEKQRNEILEANSNFITKAQAADSTSYTAGVNYLLKKSPYWTTTLDTGLKLKLPLDPFIKFNIYKRLKFKFLNIYASQKLIHYRQDGFSEVTQLSFSKKLSDVFSLSEANTLTWSDLDDRFVHRNALNLSQRLKRGRMLSYTIGANAFLSPTFYYYQYDASVSFRTPMYKKWLIGQTAFGANFLKEDNFKMDNFVLFRVELLFL